MKDKAGGPFKREKMSYKKCVASGRHEARKRILVAKLMVVVVGAGCFLDHRRRGHGRGGHGDGRQARLEGLLERGDLLHHDHRLLRLRLHLPPQLLVLQPHALDLLTHVAVVGDAAPVVALALQAAADCRRVVARAVVRLAALAAVERGPVLRVHAPQVLVEVLLPREALAGVALAVGVGAVERVLGAAVLAVDFALVPEEAA